MTCVHDGRVSLDNVSKAFEAAESAIKQNERLTLAIPVSAVNQLRYAAYHLLKVSQFPKESPDSDYHLERAFAHCERAR